MKGVSTHTETFMCSCSAARLQTRGLVVWRFMGGDSNPRCCPASSPHSFFHTCVTCSMFVTKCQFMRRREPWPRPQGAPGGPRGTLPPICCGGQLAVPSADRQHKNPKTEILLLLCIKHQVFFWSTCQKTPSVCSVQVKSVRSWSKQVCVFEHVNISTFRHRNSPHLLQIKHNWSQTFVLVCDEQAFIYGVTVNLRLDSFMSFAALRGNVPTLFWWFVFLWMHAVVYWNY